MDEMEEAVVAQASSTMRSRAAPTRFHFTDTTSTPAVGDAVFVKLGAGYHKAVIKEIWHTSEPPMYECVHASTSLHAGTAQAVPEDDITQACGTYRQYKCARESVAALASQKTVACHGARSEASKRAAVTKRAKKEQRLAQEEADQIFWKQYCNFVSRFCQRVPYCICCPALLFSHSDFGASCNRKVGCMSSLGGEEEEEEEEQEEEEEEEVRDGTSGEEEGEEEDDGEGLGLDSGGESVFEQDGEGGRPHIGGPSDMETDTPAGTPNTAGIADFKRAITANRLKTKYITPRKNQRRR